MTRLRALCCAVAVLAATLLGVSPAQAVDEVYERPADGVFRLSGHGWGHGWGMSQWGAYGAATQGRTADEILAFYYPGTTTATAPATTGVRVRLERMSRSTWVGFQPERGLRFTYFLEGAGWNNPLAPANLTCGQIKLWRVVRNGAADVQVEGSCDGATWQAWLTAPTVDAAYPVVASTNAGDGGDGTVGLLSAVDGERRGYRGEVRAQLLSGLVAATSHLPYEQYLRSVVPNEVSASWPSASLQAQAVAARSYAMREAAGRTGGTFDVYDSVRSQVYQGFAAYDGGWNVATAEEDARTDAAIAATSGRHLVHNGQVALTQFSSSNGGWTAGSTSLPYQVVKADAWDRLPSGNTRKDWTDTVTAAELQARYPAVGTVQRLRVTQRDGGGEWGGRILRMVVEGSAGQQVLSGDTQVRSGLGVYSSYLTVVQQAPGTNATGNLESVVQVPGGVKVSGWALDRDAGTGPIRVYLQYAGTASYVTADRSRPDVGKAFPGVGDAHGFEVVLPATAPSLQVCATAENVGAGQHGQLGCRTAAVRNDPFGNPESVTVGRADATVKGWVIDPDTAASTSALVRVTRGATTTDHLLQANRSRPDVGRAFPGYGDLHGFEGRVPLGPGTQDVCVWGTNIGPGWSQVVGCHRVTVTGSPFGNLERVTGLTGAARVQGWAIDPDSTGPVSIELTGSNGSRVVVPASVSRPDVAKSYPAYGTAHGLDAQLPLPRGRHSVCARALDTWGGTSTSLGCATVDVG